MCCTLDSAFCIPPLACTIIRGPQPVVTHLARSQWTTLTDVQLLAQCEVDTYRASGPGGQKRNKASSAVRIRHLPSALIVIAEESRSQHANRVKALKRLRQAFYLKLREVISTEGLSSISQRAELA